MELQAATIIISAVTVKSTKMDLPARDFKMMLDKTLLPANILIIIIGLSMFMVFQTIPVLIRSPVPFGFGESATNTGNVQLPFALVRIVFGPTSGYMISKLG